MTTKLLVGLCMMLCVAWPTVSESHCVGKHNSCQTQMTGYATWYSTNSCAQDDKMRKVPPRKEYLMSSGVPLNEFAMTCALPFHPRKVNGRRQWGERYRITNLRTGKSIVVAHMDYGPGKHAIKENMAVIDLTPAAFKKLGNLGQGKIRVKIEKIR